MNIRTLLLVSPFCLGASFALGQFEETPSFADVDTNADGALNTSEAVQAFPTLGLVDLNDDGVISKDEVAASHPDTGFSEDDTAPVGDMEYQQLVDYVASMIEQ